MTNLELTRLCAEAMGYTITVASRSSAPSPSQDAVRVYIRKKAALWYSPIHNDAQAMALVKKFGLRVSYTFYGWTVWKGGEWTKTRIGYADLNLAIVECVAKMQTDCISGI